MNQTPLVSVVCTAYNHGAFIKDALEGFIMQKTNFPFEIIVHDDASTDNTAKIIREYEGMFPELFANIYQTENQYSKANGRVVKIVFKAARGKYIAFCEGDDYWTDSLKLQKQVDFLERNNEYSLVCHDAVTIVETSNSSRLFFDSSKKKQICSTRDTFNIQFCPTASAVFRKQAVMPLSNLDLVADAGDQALIQLISLSGPLYRMYDVMSVYRKMRNGASEVMSIQLLEVLKKRINDLKILNKISNHKYQKYIKIENLLIQNRIDLLSSKSKAKTRILKIYRRMLSIVKSKI